MAGVLLAISYYPICIYYNINPIDMAILMGDGAEQMMEMGFSQLLQWSTSCGYSFISFFSNIYFFVIDINHPTIKISKLNPVKSMKI